MKMSQPLVVVLVGMTAAWACSKSPSASGSSTVAANSSGTTPASANGTPAKATTPATPAAAAAPGAAAAPAAADPAVTTSAITADFWPAGYWLGYDGATSFSVLLPGGRGNSTYKVADPSIVSLTPVSVTISQATHDALWADCLKINPSATKTIFESRFAVGTTLTSYKLTALKAGQTTLTRTPSSTSSYTPPGGNVKAVFVTQYPATAVAAGKARYNNTPAVPTTTTPACGPACHGDAAHGAPNHALGQVETLPDVAVAKWITTGSLPFVGLDAETDKGISHDWTFASPDEETGVIAYLRTLQSDNFEELLTLEFEGDTQAAQICKLTGAPGIGAGH